MKSTKDLKKEGTYRKDRHEKRLENKVQTLDTIPKPPSHFDERHRAKWIAVCEECLQLGTLTTADLDTVCTYVETFYTAADALKNLTEHGHIIQTETAAGMVIPRANPAWRIYTDSQRILTQLSDRLGFSPKARMSIKADPVSKEVDPLEWVFKSN
ncbi:MAG: phage terminase small subunit P27 family [Saprospiraceae bacterium]|nr:phage terminase small subunit P27 family [Saprospiraceae bacterium]